MAKGRGRTGTFTTSGGRGKKYTEVWRGGKLISQTAISPEAQKQQIRQAYYESLGYSPNVASYKVKREEELEQRKGITRLEQIEIERETEKRLRHLQELEKERGRGEITIKGVPVSVIEKYRKELRTGEVRLADLRAGKVIFYPKKEEFIPTPTKQPYTYEKNILTQIAEQRGLIKQPTTPTPTRKDEFIPSIIPSPNIILISGEEGYVPLPSIKKVHISETLEGSPLGRQIQTVVPKITEKDRQKMQSFLFSTEFFAVPVGVFGQPLLFKEETKQTKLFKSEIESRLIQEEIQVFRTEPEKFLLETAAFAFGGEALKGARLIPKIGRYVKTAETVGGYGLGGAFAVTKGVEIYKSPIEAPTIIAKAGTEVVPAVTGFGFGGKILSPVERRLMGLSFEDRIIIEGEISGIKSLSKQERVKALLKILRKTRNLEVPVGTLNRLEVEGVPKRDVEIIKKHIREEDDILFGSTTMEASVGLGRPAEDFDIISKDPTGSAKRLYFKLKEAGAKDIKLKGSKIYYDVYREGIIAGEYGSKRIEFKSAERVEDFLLKDKPTITKEKIKIITPREQYARKFFGTIQAYKGQMLKRGKDIPDLLRFAKGFLRIGEESAVTPIGQAKFQKLGTRELKFFETGIKPSFEIDLKPYVKTLTIVGKKASAGLQKGKKTFVSEFGRGKGKFAIIPTAYADEYNYMEQIRKTSAPSIYPFAPKTGVSEFKTVPVLKPSIITITKKPPITPTLIPPSKIPPTPPSAPPYVPPITPPYTPPYITPPTTPPKQPPTYPPYIPPVIVPPPKKPFIPTKKEVLGRKKKSYWERVAFQLKRYQPTLVSTQFDIFRKKTPHALKPYTGIEKRPVSLEQLKPEKSLLVRLSKINLSTPTKKRKEKGFDLNFNLDELFKKKKKKKKK